MSTNSIEVVTPPVHWNSVPAHVVIGNVARDLPSRPPPGNSKTLGDPHITAVRPIYDNIQLSKIERQTYYDTLSRILGPADGIQEWVGSYSAYMDRQREIYYEQLLSCHLAPVNPPSPSLASAHDIHATQPEAPISGITSVDDSISQSPGEYDYSYTCCPDPLLDLATAVLSRDECSTDLHSSTSIPVGSDTSLELIDILASPAKQEPTFMQLAWQRRIPASKTISFAPINRALLNYSALFLSAGKGSVSCQSSSSLAGALGEDSCLLSTMEVEPTRRSKEWTRPRMGRARAYSAGGGM